jgi:GDP/UDP-N,N'-diacetylbacillosamine 2-epimerase (hydrolysing)
MKDGLPVPTKNLWVFTGNRAEYGLLHPLLVGLHAHSGFEVTLLIGGEHLHNAESFAETQELQGIQPFILSLPKGTSHQVSSQISSHQMAMTHAFEALSTPDAVLVLGDRMEAMGIALATFSQGIPLVHLAAGDLTQGGCVDDRLRFAISSLATYAVCFSEESQARLLQQGLLEASHVLKSPSLAVDNALNVTAISRDAFCHDVGLNPQTPFLLFTQHPVGGEGKTSVDYFNASLEALASLEDVQVLATYPNQDAHGDDFLAVIEQSQQTYSQIHWVKHLGAERYQQALRHCVGVVGNSSSGLYETAFYQKPCLNIGNRQAGRERASNVLDCGYGVEAVSQGLQTLLYDVDFHQQVKGAVSPFGSEASVPNIVAFLKDQL